MQKPTNHDSQNQETFSSEQLEFGSDQDSAHPDDLSPAKSQKPADEGQEGESFLELYEESLKSIQEGEVVRGTIVQVDKEFVLVDIGYKSEGQIPINEFIDAEGNLTAKVGQKVDVLLERKESMDGTIILSKEKAAKIKIWDHVRAIYDKDGDHQGKDRVPGQGGVGRGHRASGLSAGVTDRSQTCEGYGRTDRHGA